MYARCGIGLNKAQNVFLCRKYMKDGTRFGPRMAADGKGIFQTSSRDVEAMIKKKKLTPQQVDDYYDRGILTQWIARPKNLHGKRLVEYDGQTGWKRGQSRRVGLLGRKVGMRTEVDLWGNPSPVTVLQIQDNQVLQSKGPKDHQSDRELYSLQVGAGLVKWHSLNKAQMGHFAKVDSPPRAKCVEFRVTKDALVPEGTPLMATHFVVGQFVDVRAKSKGKGTQGPMKRWGFKGGPASHGASLFHRGHGSTAGGNTDPSRVWPGKRMAGRMGNDWAIVHNLQVLKINVPDGLIYIRGAVPGPKNAWVQITDALKKPQRLPPPFPTHLPDKQRTRPMPKTKYLRINYADPYTKKRVIDWESKWNTARIALRSSQNSGDMLDDDEEGEEGEDGEEGAEGDE